MSCSCGTSDLVLGPGVDDLTVGNVIPGRRWGDSVVLEEQQEDDSFAEAAWPQAPILEIGDDLVITAVLADSPAGTADAMAVFEITAEQTAGLVDYTPARFVLDGDVWYSGVVTCRT